MVNGVDGGRWTMAYSRLGALVGCLRPRAGGRTAVVRVMWVVVPVGDGLSTTVRVLEHHFGW